MKIKSSFGEKHWIKKKNLFASFTPKDEVTRLLTIIFKTISHSHSDVIMHICKAWWNTGLLLPKASGLQPSYTGLLLPKASVLQPSYQIVFQGRICFFNNCTGQREILSSPTPTLQQLFPSPSAHKKCGINIKCIKNTVFPESCLLTINTSAPLSSETQPLQLPPIAPCKSQELSYQPRVTLCSTTERGRRMTHLCLFPDLWRSASAWTWAREQSF